MKNFHLSSQVASLDRRPRVLDPQNRVVLPPDVVKALGLRVGDFVTFDVEGGEVRIRRVRWVDG